MHACVCVSVRERVCVCESRNCCCSCCPVPNWLHTTKYVEFQMRHSRSHIQRSQQESARERERKHERAPLCERACVRERVAHCAGPAACTTPLPTPTSLPTTGRQHRRRRRRRRTGWGAQPRAHQQVSHCLARSGSASETPHLLARGAPSSRAFRAAARHAKLKAKHFGAVRAIKYSIHLSFSLPTTLAALDGAPPQQVSGNVKRCALCQQMRCLMAPSNGRCPPHPPRHAYPPSCPSSQPERWL